MVLDTVPPLEVPHTERTLRVLPTRETTATYTVLPSLTPLTISTLMPTPVSFSTPVPDYFIFGYSARRRELTAWRFGNGPTILMLVGGIHGGWESNTTGLMNELVQHFQSTPQDVLAGMSLVIIPMLNPDGAALGRVLEGRFNGNNVDLNRNWGCGWQETAYFRSQVVSSGSTAFSEPESAALAKLIGDIRPATVLFYHSAADGVFAGNCGDVPGDSAVMSAVLGQATGYKYGASFNAYPVTGTAPAWVDSIGIPSADVELATWQTTEFDRNLRGVMAIQCWLNRNSPVCTS
jgi:hypothetical protein